MEKLPKVLVISLNEWRSESGISTLTDIFRFWNKDQLAQLYTKTSLPNTPICDSFFQISENAIIKSVFNRRPVGKRVENTREYNEAEAKAVEAEKNLYLHARKKHSWLMTIARECVWKLGCWKTKALDNFIQEEAPDMYFVPIYPVAYMGWIQLYILKKFPKPYVCYLADDNYSYKACGHNPLAYVHRFILRGPVNKLASNCNEMFTITETEGRETDREFGTHSVVLTKSIDYKEIKYHEQPICKPIKMVYTGKLVIGRASSLVAISKAFAEINKDSTLIEMDIYSQDQVDEESMRVLDSNGCHFKGSVSREKIVDVQKNADIVVFVESLEKKYRNAARLSFSTKLTDYFKSGKCIFAIGASDIAPIEYLRDNDAAIISTSYEEILPNLKMLVEDTDRILAYGKKSFETGKRNHSVEHIRKTFLSTMMKASKEKI